MALIATDLIKHAKEQHAKLLLGSPLGGRFYKLEPHEKWSSDLEQILNYCVKNSERFPTIQKIRPARTGDSTKQSESINADFQENLDKYLLGYIKNYYWGRRPLPRPAVSTKSDPLLSKILVRFSLLPASFRDSHQISDALEAHRQCMVAENLVGALLERYIDAFVKKKGWVWCAGECMRFVDFFGPDCTPQLLLQVKNQANSENSASSSVRGPASPIVKWYRRNSKTGETFWQQRSKLRGTGLLAGFPENDGTLTEDGFQAFVESYKYAEPEKAGELIVPDDEGDEPSPQ